MAADALPDEGTAAQPAILVSARLLGVRCNHLGSANPSAAVLALGSSHRLVPICPEVAGGLPTPRPAASLQTDGRVVDAFGVDVTDAFGRGAAAAVALAGSVGAVRAVLKARSPSCGCHGRDGGGVTARALRGAGFELGDEEDETRRSATDAAGPPPTMVGPSGA
jgi:uncharacterized protein YbbK (DUF523 family)